MLTPKEKAKELVFNFAYSIRDIEDKEGFFTNIIKAKECAKIAVEECLHTCVESSIYYWKEVLSEIDNI